jgi:diguanylate cyclase (GGDEF)-like protein
VAGSGGWSTQQLVEYVAALSDCTDGAVLTWLAVERAAEALEADVAAVVTETSVCASVGFRNSRPPVAALQGATDGGVLDIPGVGACSVLVAEVDGESSRRLILARGGAEFVADEVSLARGMGRVLSLALRQLDLVEQLRSRQQLLEHLTQVQGALVRRAPLQEVLDAITQGARELLGAEVVVFRLLDEEDPGHTLVVSAHGLSPAQLRQLRRRTPLHMGLAGRAMLANTLICVSDYQELGYPMTGPGNGFTAAMATPLRDNGRTVGALLITGTQPERTYSRRDQDVLTAFADHVSLSLTDAHTMQAVHDARHDSLTGLPSRGLFYERVNQALADAPNGQLTSVLFLDLDKFKDVNDTLGHHTGDELLSTVATRLRLAVREGDTTGRLGGDEFAVLLPRTDTPTADTIAGRVLDAVSAPLDIDGHILTIHSSIGIATTAGGPHYRAKDLLRDADRAMYEAKRVPGDHRTAFTPRDAPNP